MQQACDCMVEALRICSSTVDTRWTCLQVVTGELKRIEVEESPRQKKEGFNRRNTDIVTKGSGVDVDCAAWKVNLMSFPRLEGGGGQLPSATPGKLVDYPKLPVALLKIYSG